VFCKSFFFSCSFSFGHCIFCSTSIHGFWLPLWCFQNILMPTIS
jgi:hypothetical protein